MAEPTASPIRQRADEPARGPAQLRAGSSVSPARMSAGERRLEIALAAGRLFARHGYAGTRLDDVATAAGVTKPIIYRHFESKKALYLALLERHRADLPSFVEGLETPPAALAPELLVRAILERWLDYVHANQHAWKMLFRDSSGDAEIQRVRLDVSRTAREVMAGFVASRGVVPASQIEPVAEYLTSGLAGMALWWIDHPEYPKHELVEAATRMSAPAAAPALGLEAPG